MAARVDPLTRLRKLCLALPATEEFVSHGAPTFRIVKQRTFATFADDHHGDGRVAVWLKAAPGTQEMLVESSPNRFFRPPYVGPSGWVGVILDRETDWAMLGELIEEGWRLVAPQKLLAASAAPPPGRPPETTRKPAKSRAAKPKVDETAERKRTRS